MKGWMGGKRRHIAVRRKDPAARQREEFARRRELALQSLNRGQSKGEQMTMDMDQYRSRRPPRLEGRHRLGRAQAPEHAPPRVRRDQSKPFPFSNDLLMAADPSQLESMMPEFRNVRKRARDYGVREERESKRRSTSSRDEHADAFTSSYPAPDIRIFDGDDEKTPLYRRRTLPDTFLKSQVTHQQRSPRTSKYFAKETKSTSKRLKHSTTPDLSRRLAGLNFSPPERVAKFNGISKDGSRKRREASEQIMDVRQTLHLPASPSESFRMIRGRSEDRGRSLRIPAAAYERPILSSDRIRDRGHGKPRRQALKSPEHVRSSAARWKIVDSGSRYESPILPARNKGALDSIRSTRLESRFPLIEAESYSPPILSPVKKQPESEVIGFRSLLASEPITHEDFSAEVQALEAKMLERPDSGGGRFKVRRRRQFQRGTEDVKPRMQAEGYEVLTNRGMGWTLDRKIHKECISDTKDVKGMGLKVGTREMKGSRNDSVAAEAEVESNDVVDVTLITTERNPMNVGRGKRLARG